MHWSHGQNKVLFRRGRGEKRLIREWLLGCAASNKLQWSSLAWQQSITKSCFGTYFGSYWVSSPPSMKQTTSKTIAPNIVHHSAAWHQVESSRRNWSTSCLAQLSFHWMSGYSNFVILLYCEKRSSVTFVDERSNGDLMIVWTFNRESCAKKNWEEIKKVDEN